MRKFWFLVPLTGVIVALALTLTSSATAVRTGTLVAAATVSQPVVTGTAQVGDNVHVGGAAGATVAWDQCGNTTNWCGEIPASVGQWSYTIPASEQGFYLRAQVTGPDGAVGVSNATALVAKAVVTSSSSSSSSTTSSTTTTPTSTSTTTTPTSTTSSTTTTPSSSSTTTTSSTTTSGGSNCAGTPGSASPNYASMDACGFPSPDTTGVPAGTTLTPSGSITASTPGQVISDLQINGSIDVTASNVVIKDDDIASNSQTGAIRIESGVTGVQVEYDTIHGTDGTGSGNLQAAVYNTNYSDAANAVTIDHVDFYNGQRIMHGPGTLTNSFCLDNVAVSGAHYECVYEGGGGVVINHNTLLTAFTQTAAVFVSTDFAALTDVQITNNLLAGGGYVIYGDATNEHNYGIQSEEITGNYFSALYYPDSGYYGPDDGEYLPSVAVWSDNVNDAGQTVPPT